MTDGQSHASGPTTGPLPALPPTDRAGATAYRTRLPESVLARRGVLVRLAYRFCWNLDDAEEAVQNALLLAATRQEQLIKEDKLWPWIRSIVVRQSHDIVRRESRKRRLHLQAMEDRAATASAHDPQAETQRSDSAEHLRRLIDELPERQRTALILRHLEEMGYGEIAEIMGISESTARVQVRNAREALCRKTAQNQRDGPGSS